MGLSLEEYKRQLEEKYGQRRKAEFEAEWPTVSKYFTAVSERLEDTYEIDKVLAVGGTGIVHVGHHKRFHQPVVLKFNRPNIDPESVSMVENEANILPTLSHPNIISVLDLGKLTEHTPTLTYIVEPFITGSKPLFTPQKDRIGETWLHGTLENLKKQMPDTLQLGGDHDAGQAAKAITSLLGDIAALFSQWASLLSHVHSTHGLKNDRYLYLDVKPENVLVDDHLHLTSIDYGSIERLDATDPSPREVFITDTYAHPDLLKRQKDKPSSNRVRASIKRSELKPAFDHFSLGVSMLEVLNEVAAVRPNLVPQLPLYRSLHFLATRLLGGLNSSRAAENHYPHASQVFPGLRDSDYLGLVYEDLADTYRDLEKERGRWNLEAQVPELASYSKDVVRVVPGFNTVLTPRLRRVIEHPLVARLKYVSQLGLVSLVYPTADHSRYDHALGSYTYTTYYLKSLFNDLGNPLFRNVVGSEDLNAVLLAALLHDLGQYPLAHDLEEVHERLFKHGQIGTALLKDPMGDRAGRSLVQIIEDPQNGWGVEAKALSRILGAHSKNQDLVTDDPEPSLKTAVLAAIVDGPVDADKADYIIRDSVRCELPYGDQLDLERLLRVLTVAIIPDDDGVGRRITLGVYDKGLASAHAFGQARYQLLSTVYWHHTSRIAKTMLQYATTIGLPPDLFGPKKPSRERQELELREQLLAFIKSLVPPFQIPTDHPARVGSNAIDLGLEPPQDVRVIEETTLVSSTDVAPASQWYPGISWTDWLMLEWIRRLPKSTLQSNALIDGLQSRRLYKRVATFPRGGNHDNMIRKLTELNWPDRLDLCVKLHQGVCDRLRRDWAHLNTAATMAKSEFDKLCDGNLVILIDVPNPAKKVGYDRALGVVPELREKSYQQDARQASEDKRWREITEKMIEGIAPVRVLCHPEVRNLMSALLHPVDTWIATQVDNIL